MIGILVRRREQTENEAVQQTDLRTRCTPARLSFANHMDRLVAGDRAPSSPERTKMLTGADSPLDGAVILLQDVVKILHGPMAAVFLQRSFGFELHDGRWVSCVLVGVDDPWRRMVLAAQGFGQKALGRPLHRVWPRGGSRSSHRSNPQPGINTPTCP